MGNSQPTTPALDATPAEDLHLEEDSRLDINENHNPEEDVIVDIPTVPRGLQLTPAFGGESGLYFGAHLLQIATARPRSQQQNNEASIEHADVTANMDELTLQAPSLTNVNSESEARNSQSRLTTRSGIIINNNTHQLQEQQQHVQPTPEVLSLSQRLQLAFLRQHQNDGLNTLANNNDLGLTNGNDDDDAEDNMSAWASLSEQQQAFLPLLRQLENMTPHVAETKTVRSTIHLPRASLSVLPVEIPSTRANDRTVASTSPSEANFLTSNLHKIGYAVQFQIDCSAPCTVQVYYCVKEIFDSSANTFIYETYYPNATMEEIEEVKAHDNESKKNEIIGNKKLLQCLAALPAYSVGLDKGLGHLVTIPAAHALNLSRYNLKDLCDPSISSDARSMEVDGGKDNEDCDNEYDSEDEEDEDIRLQTRAQSLSRSQSVGIGSLNRNTALRDRVRSRRKDNPKPTPEKNVSPSLVPVVIVVKARSEKKQYSPRNSVNALITHASFVSKSMASDLPRTSDQLSAVDYPVLDVKVMRQKLVVNGIVYNVHEIYGLERDADEPTTSSDCVICMSDPANTIVIPCRHMCLCENCADTLKYQTVKCPMCRNPMRALLKLDLAQKIAATTTKTKTEATTGKLHRNLAAAYSTSVPSTNTRFQRSIGSETDLELQEIEPTENEAESAYGGGTTEGEDEGAELLRQPSRRSSTRPAVDIGVQVAPFPSTTDRGLGVT